MIFRRILFLKQARFSLEWSGSLFGILEPTSGRIYAPFPHHVCNDALRNLVLFSLETLVAGYTYVLGETFWGNARFELKAVLKVYNVGMVCLRRNVNLASPRMNAALMNELALAHRGATRMKSR